MKILKHRLGTLDEYDLVKRKFHVVSISEGCWQSLGSTGNHAKAIGIAHDFIYTLIDDPEEDKPIMSPVEFDEANYCWEQIKVTIPETKSHSELEYPIMIFYEDKLLKHLTGEEVKELREKGVYNYFTTIGYP